MGRDVLWVALGRTSRKAKGGVGPEDAADHKPDAE
jgi:hypothetical protein